MSGPVATRRRASKSNPTNDAAPPAKKAKLSQPSANLRQNGFKSMVNGSPAQKPVAKFSNAKNTRSARVKDATAVVAGGQGGMGDVHMEDTAVQPIELSSGGESSDDDSADEEDEDEVEPQTNGAVQSETAQGEEEMGDADELSFGDRLRAQEPEPIQESRIVDVDSAFDDLKDESRDLTSTKPNRSLAPTNASSLGTVLSQALRTNDTELLDSCLRVVDVDTVYATVERLPSPLVGTLLQKLAERLHKKPGRAGILMIWVQWALAAHGGYLASQPQLVKQLTSLNRVLKERASGLQPLLSLKGRLDMLQAQLDLRRRNQRKAADDDEEEAVIYVEGEDDFVSSDEEDEDEDEDSDSEVPATKQKRALEDFDDDDDDSSVDQMPTTMEMDDEEDSEEDSEAGGLLDDEAEETDNDVDDDGMSEPMSDDMEDEEGLSESEEESKPARRSTAARAGLKGRR